jgi:tetratricopeptide (TPR) repeat protein
VRKLVKVIVAGAVLVVGVTTTSCRRPKQPIDSAALLKALADARQPAAVATLVKQAADAGDACQYAEVAAHAALDADLHGLVPKLLDAAPTDCKRASTLVGERTEALARAGETARADSAAQDLLKADPTNPYAELALARVAYDKAQMVNTADFAARALKDGRGVEAERLLGRSTLARSLFKEAEAHFQNLLRSNPNDAEAAFSAGICNDKLGRYTQAREAFLQTLRIDPKHQPAREYLVVLTHNAGFNDEARHDLAKLGELIPKDSQPYLQLEQLLDGNPADGGVPDAGTPKHVPGLVQGKR